MNVLLICKFLLTLFVVVNVFIWIDKNNKRPNN